jgi:hypothetical protein
MGNRRARELALERDDEEAWRRVRDEPRLAIDDVCARGIGMRRLQLLCLPSRVQPSAFEVRQTGSEWRLYGSRVAESWPAVRLIGYDLLPVDSETLAAFFSRITALSLPLVPILNHAGGADGTVFQLAVFGDLYSEWRFQWWSDAPPQWRPLVEIAQEMLRTFVPKANAGA